MPGFSKILRHGALLALVAPLLSVAAPGQAADPTPTCDPAEGLTVGFSGLPARTIGGRTYIATVDTNGGLADSGTVTVSADGRSLGRLALDGVDLFVGADFHFTASPGTRQVTLAATVVASRWNIEAGAFTPCQVSTTAYLAGATGRAMPAPSVGLSKRGVWVDDEWVDDHGSRTVAFRLARPASCADSYALSPVAVRVRLKGIKKWATLETYDQCSGWGTNSTLGAQRRAKGLRLGIDDYSGYDDPYTAYFVPLTGDKNSTKRYQYEIRTADPNTGRLGRTLRKGGIKVKTTSRSARRVYATKGGRINDEYWNYCVRNGEEVWMHNGNAYCIRAGETKRKITLTKK